MHLLPAFLHRLKTRTQTCSFAADWRWLRMLWPSSSERWTPQCPLLESGHGPWPPWPTEHSSVDAMPGLGPPLRDTSSFHRFCLGLLPPGASNVLHAFTSWKKPSTPEVTTLETTRVGTIIGSPNRAQHSSHPHGWHQTCEWRSLLGMDVPAPGDATLFSD